MKANHAFVFLSYKTGEFQKYLVRLRGQAIIEWKDEDLKKMYEQYRAQQKKAS